MKPGPIVALSVLAIASLITFAMFPGASDESSRDAIVDPAATSSAARPDDTPTPPPVVDPATAETATPDAAHRVEERAAEPTPPPVAPIPTPAEPGRVKGVVLDAESNQPIDSARVVLTRADGIEFETKTTPAGGFEFTEVEAGELCLLNAAAAGYAPPREAPRVRAAGGRGAEIVIRLPLSRVVRGRVVDEHGNGVAAAIDVRRGARRLSVTSDTAGNFVIDDVTRRLGIFGKPPEYLAQIWVRSGAHRDAFRDLVRDDLYRDVPFDLRVELGSVIRGRLAGPGDLPLSDVEVTCYPIHGSSFAGMRVTRTDLHGRYEFGGLDPGDHHVESQPTVERLSPIPRALECAVDGRNTIDGIDFVYREGFEIEGRVIAQRDESPLTDRLVTLHHDDWLEPLVTLTDDRGEFRFGPLPEGEYVVVQRGMSWFDSREPLLITAPAGKKDLLFVVDEPPRDGSLRIIARDATSGTPLPAGTRIDLRLFSFESDSPERRFDRVVVGESGIARLMDLRRVHFAGTAIVEGFAPAPLEFDIVTEAQEVAVELAFEIGVTVRGRVLDETGLPVEGARVRAFRRDEIDVTLDVTFEDEAGVLTDSSGEFALAHVDPRAAWVAAFADDLAPGRLAVDPGARDVYGLELVLHRGSQVFGVAYHGNQSPARRFLIEFVGSIAAQATTTDDRGRFAFPTVESGPFELRDGDGNVLLRDQAGDQPLELEIEVPR